jgi:ribosomal protein S18 acetylase RimI-like enzyme
MEFVTFDRMKERIKEGKYPEILVAIEEDKVVGMAIYTISFDLFGDGETFLYAISVKLEYRRKKIGTALINAVKEKAREVNSSLIILLVYKDNVGAFSFYDTFGFSEAGDEFKQIAIPVDEE